MRTFKTLTAYALIATTLTGTFAIAEVPGTSPTLYRKEQAKLEQQNAEIVRKIFREFLTTDKRNAKDVAEVMLGDSRNVVRNIGIMQDEIDGLEMIVRANAKTDDKIAQLEHELRVVAAEQNKTLYGRRNLYQAMSVIVGALVGGTAGYALKSNLTTNTGVRASSVLEIVSGSVLGAVGGALIGDGILRNMKAIDDSQLDLDENIDSK